MLNRLYKDLIDYLVKFITLSDIARLLRLSKETHALFSCYAKIRLSLIKLIKKDIMTDYLFIGVDPYYNYIHAGNLFICGYDNDTSKAIINSLKLKIFYITEQPVDSCIIKPHFHIDCPNIECIHGKYDVSLLCPMNRLKILIVSSITCSVTCNTYESVKNLVIYNNILGVDSLIMMFPNVKNLDILILPHEIIDYNGKICFKEAKIVKIRFAYTFGSITKKIEKIIANIKTLFPKLKFITIDMKTPYNWHFDENLFEHFGNNYQYIFR